MQEVRLEGRGVGADHVGWHYLQQSSEYIVVVVPLAVKQGVDQGMHSPLIPNHIQHLTALVDPHQHISLPHSMPAFYNNPRKLVVPEPTHSDLFRTHHAHKLPPHKHPILHPERATNAVDFEAHHGCQDGVQLVDEAGDDEGWLGSGGSEDFGEQLGDYSDDWVGGRLDQQARSTVQ